MSVQSSGPQRRDALTQLLENPLIWRGGNAAQVEAIPSGFGALDERLPGKGWPRAGLVEVLISRFGIGELYLVMPALAALSSGASARWCTFISPPLEPFAPALAAHGLRLERLLVVRTVPMTLWAFEQGLSSGDCDAVLCWPKRVRVQDIRRLQLAAERGRTLGVLFREHCTVRESSSAMLRLAVQPLAQGLRVDLIKSRGGLRGAFDLAWPAGAA